MGDGPPGFPQGSTCPVVLGCASPGSPEHFAYRTITVYGEPFQDSSAMYWICNFPTRLRPRPATSRYPSLHNARRLERVQRFRLFPVRSPLLGESHLLSLPPGTKMVHFPGFASRSLLYSGADIPTLLGILLQDSEIPGSQPVCGSPRLIAAYHVLLRLPSPRHPPCALSSLTIKFTPPEIPCGIQASQFYDLLVLYLPVVI